MSLEIFKNDHWNIRIKKINGEVWFVASDIARSLGYEKPNNAIKAHCRMSSKISYPETGQPINIIPESDVYRLIFRSKLPSAEDFQTWVCEEVLPSIRKAGTYSLEPKIPQSFSEALQLAADQAKQLEEQKPLVDFAETIQGSSGNISMGEMAKLSGKIGRNKLFKLLKDKNVLMPKNIPYQVFIERGYFEVTEKSIKNGQDLKPVTLVTGKGQGWLIKKLDDWLKS